MSLFGGLFSKPKRAAAVRAFILLLAPGTHAVNAQTEGRLFIAAEPQAAVVLLQQDSAQLALSAHTAFTSKEISVFAHVLVKGVEQYVYGGKNFDEVTQVQGVSAKDQAYAATIKQLQHAKAQAFGQFIQMLDSEHLEGQNREQLFTDACTFTIEESKFFITGFSDVSGADYPKQNNALARSRSLKARDAAAQGIAQAMLDECDIEVSVDDIIKQFEVDGITDFTDMPDPTRGGMVIENVIKDLNVRFPDTIINYQDFLKKKTLAVKEFNMSLRRLNIGTEADKELYSALMRSLSVFRRVELLLDFQLKISLRGYELADTPVVMQQKTLTPPTPSGIPVPPSVTPIPEDIRRELLKPRNTQKKTKQIALVRLSRSQSKGKGTPAVAYKSQ
jgi:hypothetical protein